MKCFSIFADDDGESHLAEIEVPLRPFEILPGVFLGMSDPAKATSVRIAVKPRGLTVADWHTAPGRQFVLRLNAWSEYETSDGDVRRVPAGSAVLYQLGKRLTFSSWAKAQKRLGFRPVGWVNVIRGWY